MKIANVIKRLIYPNTYSSDAYIRYIQKKGGWIGDKCYIFQPTSVSIDMARPWLLEIGNNVIIASGVTVLTHDYSHTVIRKMYGENIGDVQPVKIGNNVFIGMNSMILMGTSIGDNVIIGANTVVRGCIPNNVVVAGNPGKVVCTIEDYYNKRQEKQIERAKENVLKCRKHLNRNPSIKEMGDAFFWLYMPRTQQAIEEYPQFFNLPGENKDKMFCAFMNSKSMFDSYESFLESVK